MAITEDCLNESGNASASAFSMNTPGRQDVATRCFRFWSVQCSLVESRFVGSLSTRSAALAPHKGRYELSPIGSNYPATLQFCYDRLHDRTHILILQITAGDRAAADWLIRETVL